MIDGLTAGKERCYSLPSSVRALLSIFSMYNYGTRERRCTMDAQELKKFLAGLGIAGLIAGTSLMAGGCATTGKSS